MTDVSESTDDTTSKSEANGDAREPKVLTVDPTKPNVTEEVFFHHYQIISGLENARSDINDKLRKARDIAEKAGVDKAAMKFAKKYADMPQDRRFFMFRNADQYLRYMQVPTGTQLGAFQEEMDTNPPQQDPFQQGLLAGKMGHNRDSGPFDEDDPAWHEWDKGWIDGQSAIAEAMTPAETQDDQPTA